MTQHHTHRVFTDKEEGKDYKSRISFYLEDVNSWEEYVYQGTFKDYPGPKTWITFGDTSIVALVDYDEFSKLMHPVKKVIGFKP